ncbi:polyphosphate polymerase domain-containing protein [Paenibacillus woosongensis]|uniref:Polyphosphate polymerase domain-containing protein n=1 Tax=Paenibacillus woosongensis TaxID=307580 RepID=A0AA95L2L3_9BACL|nr:polyphosphate polymerase domain-containing protein [Paenibacillus woosongensis]WHX49902.1 polyphosphate polymerase domain-containing protein [Paenibacillus woosongensis]
MSTKLNFRHELKFLVNRQQYFLMRQRLVNLMDHDQHTGSNGEYHIRSLYFDDMDNTALHEKLGGIRQRCKYRIRIYNMQDDVIHFEKKIKLNDYIAKVKEPITRGMYHSILNGDFQVLHVPEKPLLMELYQQMNHRLLRPKVIVDYVREPFVFANGNVRITFDKDLRTGLHAVDIFDHQLQSVSAIDDKLIILEVKYDEFIPETIRAAIQLEGLSRQSASKYVICCKYLKENSWEDY